MTAMSGIKTNYPEFMDLIKNYEIIGIQESKTDDCDVINIPGYNIFLTTEKIYQGENREA